MQCAGEPSFSEVAAISLHPAQFIALLYNVVFIDRVHEPKARQILNGRAETVEDQMWAFQVSQKQVL